MTTKLALDPELLALALELSGETTEAAAVTKALQEFVALRRQKKTPELIGKLDWQHFDYKVERRRQRRRPVRPVVHR